MKHLLAFLISLVLVVSLQAPLHAQVSEEIVVTASALPEPLADTPATVTVITRQEIDQLTRDGIV